ncbi:MAG: hypothetical protein A2583_05450 [Bdellovibrionales bacterium RIFOXYD1_FULL_53_11]|nr:MAG: hypothetical protein A2583_05450 [Bdellovibrionales bacterium RIFOXYD1_FULL_53_11]
MPLTKARLKISDYNESRKNRIKHDERRIRMVSLSLTSMVDMFAIMVIFLLANSSTVAQWIEVGHSIQLPKAKSTDTPVRAATVQVSSQGVFLGLKRISDLGKPESWDATAEKIKTALTRHAKKGAYVNIVAHHTLPFGLMKRVVAACQDAGFKNVNLAVQPKSGS